MALSRNNNRAVETSGMTPYDPESHAVEQPVDPVEVDARGGAVRRNRRWARWTAAAVAAWLAILVLYCVVPVYRKLSLYDEIEQLGGMAGFRQYSVHPWFESRFGDVGVRALRPMISVGLGNPEFNDNWLPRLRAAPDLEILSLGSPTITDAGMAHVGRLSQLKSLFVECPQVGDKGMTHVGQLSGLTFLGLSRSGVSDAGLAALTPLTRLEQFRLSELPVTDAGLTHVGKLRALRDLSLDNTRITDAGLAEIGALTELNTLNLSGTAITDAGLVHLVRLRKLWNLSVDETAVTEEGLRKLLPHLPEINRLYFSEGQVSPEGISDFWRLRPGVNFGVYTEKPKAPGYRRAMKVMRPPMPVKRIPPW
jgi:Leucine Rich repeat